MFVAGAAIVIARRPDAVTNPQFWAEDGTFWFADAYNTGVHSLVQSAAGVGYLLSLPRLVAIPVTGLSLGHAALVFNLVGITVQVAPAAFFLSRRFEDVAPSAAVRGLLGLGYVLIPNTEVDVTLTNAQWHLAIVAVMVLVARPPRGRAGRWFDAAGLALSGLTGPFAVILLPAAVARAVTLPSWRRWYGALSGMLLATLLVQAVTAHLSGRAPTAPLGLSVRSGVEIIADRVVLPGTFGEQAYSHVSTPGSGAGVWLAALLALFAIAVVGFVLLRSGAPVRIFLVACIAVTVLGLLAPIGTPSGSTAWTALATSDVGERYFFIGETAWLVALVWAVSRIPWPALRAGGGVGLAALFASGSIAAWSYPPYTDFHPALYTAELRAARPGTTVLVPINPGGPWRMALVRH
jgi:hypothetical protein